jgi:hypothetical protein
MLRSSVKNLVVAAEARVPVTVVTGQPTREQ